MLTGLHVNNEDLPLTIISQSYQLGHFAFPLFQSLLDTSLNYANNKYRGFRTKSKIAVWCLKNHDGGTERNQGLSVMRFY